MIGKNIKLILVRIKRVLLLDSSVYLEIRDESGGLYAAVAVLIGSLILAMLPLIASMPPFLVFVLFILPVFEAAGTWVLHIIAKLLGGKSDFAGYFKCICYAHSPFVIRIVSPLHSLIALAGMVWWLACAYKATKNAHELSSFRTLVVLLPLFFAILIELSFIIAFKDPNFSLPSGV